MTVSDPHAPMSWGSPFDVLSECLRCMPEQPCLRNCRCTLASAQIESLLEFMVDCITKHFDDEQRFSPTSEETESSGGPAHVQGSAKRWSPGWVNAAGKSQAEVVS